MTEWIVRLIDGMGYFGIALLMFAENVFPPLPSEVIMPMAGFAASRGDLHIAGVTAAGTVGTIAGAFFWYLLARRLGEDRLKRLARRHGRWLTTTPQDIESLQGWFKRHCHVAVPLGHLVPGVRTLISIPAGLFAMPPARFALLTLLGAGAWTTALAAAGYLLGERFDQVDRYLGPLSTTIMAAIALWYVWRVATFHRQTA